MCPTRAGAGAQRSAWRAGDDDVRQLAGIPPARESGKLIALGMATAKRSAQASEIATLAEQGVALESNSWSGVLARTAHRTPSLQN
jgi:tripartite-type tricarboxylate transporter receptor subunit TctC